MTSRERGSLSEGLAHLERQDAVAAERAFRAALSVNENRAPVLQGLGKSLYDQRRFERFTQGLQDEVQRSG